MHAHRNPGHPPQPYRLPRRTLLLARLSHSPARPDTPGTRRRRIIGEILLLAQPTGPLLIEVCYLVVGLVMVALGLLTLWV